MKIIFKMSLKKMKAKIKKTIEKKKVKRGKKTIVIDFTSKDCS